MMNTLKSRLLNAAIVAGSIVLAPAIASAQDYPGDPTASNFIGALVAWLLPIGGAGAVFTMFALDKQAQQSRTPRR